MTDDFALSKGINARRKKEYAHHHCSRFLGRSQLGERIASFRHRNYGPGAPVASGKSAVVNLLEGWGAFLIGGIFWYFTWMQHGDPVLVYTFAACGVLAINLFHACVWRAHPEFYKHILPGQK
jgi:hypothetical protein